jgi:hypothetical protein
LVAITAHPRIIWEASNVDAIESFILKFLFISLTTENAVNENNERARISPKNR